MKRLVMVMLLALPLIGSAQQAAKLQKKADGGDTKAMLELAFCYERGHGVAVDSAKALSLIQKATDMGDADAKGHLARYYLYYSTLGYDTLSHLRLAKESAAAGSGYGMTRVGICYERGLGVEKDYEKSAEWYNKAMAKGDALAYSIVAENYMFGSGGYEHDVETGAKMAQKIPEGLSAQRKYEMLAYYCLQKRDNKGCWKWLNKGIANDNIYALIEAARYRAAGWGMEKDEKGALAEMEKLLKKYPGNQSVQLGYLWLLNAVDPSLCDTALCMRLALETEEYESIGTSYYFGNYTERDTAKALYYWQKGVDAGDADAMMQMFGWYMDQGDEKKAEYYIEMAYEKESPRAAMVKGYQADQMDENITAISYYLQAADWGEEEGRVNAGKLWAYLEQYDKAYACFDRAIANFETSAWYWKAALQASEMKNYNKTLEEGVKHGCEECAIALGNMILESDKPNYKKAADYYMKADNGDGYQKVARLYIEGLIGDMSESDMQKAKQLLIKSAKMGDLDGMYNLAWIYGNEDFGTPKMDSVYYWNMRLADAGDTRGTMGVALCYETGRGVEPDTMKAIDWYLKAGEQGSSNGYAFAADFYMNGLGVPEDEVRAFTYDKMGASIHDGNYGALIRLAACYLGGYGTEKDTAAAIPILREAADMGSYKSCAILGDLFYSGLGGLEKNIDSATAYYYRASQGDEPRGDYMMGRLLCEWGNYSSALEFLTSAANNGSLDAYVAIAECLLNGNGVDANPEAAYSMFRQAADSYHHPQAYTMLGVMHYLGSGCQRDTALAYRYTDTAASMGNTHAMRNMGVFTGQGMACERDTVEAIKWFERAANAGDIKAMIVLAESHEEGEWAEQDMNKAAYWYQRAADNGNLKAIWRLGLCYEEGEGVILNSQRAYQLYMQAAEGGSEMGMYLVARCYSNGTYVSENDEKAAEWYLKAAENGHLASCYIIGMMYAQGEGVKKNNKEAKKWLTIAAENGIEAAEEALKNL